jgi:hypothetical protein
VTLHYDAGKGQWLATVPIPAVPDQDYSVHVDVTGAKNGGADTVITVTHKIPLIYARGTPSNPRTGQVVRVVAKILAANVAAGDLLVLEDGAQLRLPAPSGNIYAFSITVKHELPYHGLIFTKAGARYPFVILP